MPLLLLLSLQGMAQCSAGGASAAADGCANIEPAEFV
jgi:hypothetical protein